MLSIDEAIENLKYDIEIDMYIRDIAPQLAEWLEELKALKNGLNIKCDSLNEALDKGKKIGYNKALDDFVKEICKMIAQSENNGNYRFYAVEIKQAIAEITEQLKAGDNNADSN